MMSACTPLAFTQQQTSDQARHSNSWGMIARLKPGVTLAQAQERIDDLNRRNLDLFPSIANCSSTRASAPGGRLEG